MTRHYKNACHNHNLYLVVTGIVIFRDTIILLCSIIIIIYEELERIIIIIIYEELERIIIIIIYEELERMMASNKENLSKENDLQRSSEKSPENGWLSTRKYVT